MPRTHVNAKTDNRDLFTTDLVIPETVVTVSPWELLRNSIENAFEDCEDLIIRVEALEFECSRRLDQMMQE